MARYLWAAVLAGYLVATPASAAEGVGRRLDPQVEASVDELLEKGETARVRLQAAIVLGHAGTERSIPALAGALEDPEAGVRAAAALALGNLGSAAAVRPLVEHVVDPDPFVRDHVRRAILSLRGPAVLRRLAVEAGSAGPAARAILAEAFAGFTDEEADAALVVFFDEHDPAVREAHRAVVAGLPVARRDAIVRAGLNSPCPRVRLGAIRQAGPIAGAGAVAPLLVIAVDDGQPPTIRAEARRAIVAVRELIDPVALEEAVNATGDPAERARLVALAGLRGGEIGERVVVRGLADPASVVRWSAGRAALDLPRSVALDSLKRALGTERNARVRRGLERSARILERGEPPRDDGAVAIDELPEP